MRVVVFNVGYSPNLGDGLLSECLERQLSGALDGAEMVRLDLAGRTAYQPGSSRRGLALSILGRLPRPARHLAARTLIGRLLRRLVREQWRPQLARADAVVIGGGNLLADSDLNFPLKIAAACREAARCRLPTAVFGVGVAQHWTRPGRLLFRQALGRVLLCYASVRDERSRDNWAGGLSGIAISSPVIVRDPGLLAADVFPAVSRPAAPGTGGIRVGLGITHPKALHYHADQPLADVAAFGPWFLDVARAFAAAGDSVHLFTNGSPEDEAFLDQIAPALVEPAAGGQVHRVPRFSTPEELALFTSGLDMLCAHRLHACIAAYSYGIPHIGFTWDSKLASFFRSVQREEYVCEAVVTPVAEIVALARRAVSARIDPEIRASVLAQARQDVDQLAQALQAAVRT